MADQVLIDTILDLCSKGRFSTDDGETFFQGESLNALIDDLRDRGYSISNRNAFGDRLKQLGFRVIRARPKMAHKANPKACRAECNCVTI